MFCRAHGLVKGFSYWICNVRGERWCELESRYPAMKPDYSPSDNWLYVSYSDGCFGRNGLGKWMQGSDWRMITHREHRCGSLQNHWKLSKRY